jgi:methionine synthase II (cobalamin-independent)
MTNHHQKMDKYPDNFTRVYCHEEMVKNQAELVKQIRKKFYDEVMKATELCEQNIPLVFPDKLWHEHKIQMIKEILTGFGKVKLTTINAQCNVIKIISDINEIPLNVKQVTIEFHKEF